MPQNTKASIMESFAKLAMRIPLDKITVKDVVDNCGVNRNTFYYYFQDIYALVEDFFTCGIQSQQAGEFEDTWISGFVMVAHFFKSNPRIIKNIYISVGRDMFDSFIYEHLRLPIADRIKSSVPEDKYDPDKANLMAVFYSEALSGILAGWVRKDMKSPPETIAREILAAFGHGIGTELNAGFKQNLCKGITK